MSETLTFTINVQNEGALSAVNSVKQSFAGLQSAFSSIKNIGLVQFSQSLQDMKETISQASQPGLDFQQNMADLQAITGIAGKELDTLNVAAREMGKKSGIGASQAAEAFKLLASNIDISTIGGVEGLKKLQEATITLSQAAGTDLPMSANTMAGVMNQFKIDASEAARVINVLGAGAKYGAAEIPDLAESLKNTGAVAAIAGVSLESTVGALEILSQNMIKGSEAGTGLRNVILRLQTKDIPGVDLKTQGLSGALAALQNRMGDTAFMAKTFGQENIAVAQTLIKNAAEVENMTRKVTGTNVAYEQAAIRTRTYKHEVQLAKAKMDDFKISIFNATGSMVPWVESIGGAAAEFSRIVPAMSFMKDMTGGLIGSIKTLVTGLKGANTAQEALSFAFTKTPWGAVLTGAVLLGGALLALSSRTKELTAQQQLQNEIEIKAASYIAHERIEVDQLFTALKKTNPASDERKKIIDEINQKYPGYLKNMDLERAGADQIAVAYSQVVAQINKAAQAEASKKLMAETFQAILEQEPIVAEEKKRNKIAEDAQKAENSAAPSSFGFGAGSLGSRTIIYSPEQSKLTDLKKKYDLLTQRATQIEIDNLRSTTGGGGKVVPSPIVPNPKDDKETAGSSIGGDSRAIKNINMNIDSIIKENHNVIEQGSISLQEFENMLRQCLARVLNDVNLAGE